MKKLTLYTDGSHITKPVSAFGSGLYIPELNVKQNYGNLNKSNQYAELYAIKMALLAILKYKQDYDEFEIVSDSTYAIGCMSTWRWSWQKAGYGSERISNYEIIKECWNLENRIYFSGKKYHFKHVRGHNKDKNISEKDKIGNAIADSLATSASKQAANKKSIL